MVYKYSLMKLCSFDLLLSILIISQIYFGFFMHFSVFSYWELDIIHDLFSLFWYIYYNL